MTPTEANVWARFYAALVAARSVGIYDIRVEHYAVVADRMLEEYRVRMK